ncbi:MAG: acetyl-CoA carboxylase biotin carboxylase subunit [Gemmatimonadales bacterium]
MRPLGRVLVANRGEIALRIIRACHEEGLEAVAVYSTADHRAAHVQAADIAVPIGGPAPTESYLVIDRLIEAALEHGADSVHPGYGFLAERAEFADAVEAADLTFIGPPASAIRAMGNKTEARRRMAEAGVPVVPGSSGLVSDSDEARAVAEDIGYPVMVKAALGGGGRGMRLVERPGDLTGALETAASEAHKAFGDAGVYLEKFIERPRHVEIQILADGRQAVHFGERECSIQRRHQKLVEEAPSVAVDDDLRARMGQAAVAGALAVGYRSAGTCEFLLAADGSFYFLEMNTRIQVEHPVTELVYGIDLVREQLRVARGGELGITQDQLRPTGWAIECRITSEDPSNGFLPSIGQVDFLRIPAGPWVRWDSGISVGDEITLFYDSLLGKLIVWGASRDDALQRMRRALDELAIVGVGTNQGFHRRLLGDEAFCAGDFDIQFLDRRPDLMEAAPDQSLLSAVAVAAAMAEDEARESRRPIVATDGWQARRVWLQTARLEGLR